MTIDELEQAISRLSFPDLTRFAAWFEEFRADAWDRQIEQDAISGRLQDALRQADDDFESGRCTPL